MDNTWRKAIGTKVADDGTVIELAVETIDGRKVIHHLVPEMISTLAVTLLAAKSKAQIAAMGPETGTTGPENPAPIHMPIEASRFIQTNYVNRGRTLIQLVLPQGGILEFLVPNEGTYQETTR